MILAAFLVVGLLVLQEIAADFASIKPSALYYDYVAVSWLDDSVALAAGYSVTGGVLLRSTTQGKSWTQVGSSMGFSGLFGISSRYISNTWYTIIVDDAGMVYRSTDTGTTWTSLQTYFPTALLGVTIGTNGYVFVSGIDYVAYNNTVKYVESTWNASKPLYSDSLNYYDIR